MNSFLLYGSTSFVGEAIARLAVERDLRPILAGRSAARVEAIQRNLGPVLGFSPVQGLLKRSFRLRAGSTAGERAQSRTLVWGEVEDDEGRKATSLLHGPEGGVEWTSQTALGAVEKVLSGNAPAGFQTPSRAYGAGFALESEGVTRRDVH